ncbi:unnamed protein product [Blepharisma stoltei]|uniref:Uncharacterized protein n=1 Tax=Blepharisma stoltei TaxID=1481888 RepID=A0AAU9KQ03_9CILI|nr:unnamed protein product [Blepharisma stoltei]
MEKVKAYLITSLGIDLLFLVLVLISLHLSFFALGDYDISLTEISTKFEINLGRAYCSVTFEEFQQSSCRLIDYPIDIICDLKNNLEGAGIVYIIFSLLSIISLLFSVLHFILILIVKIKPFPFLSYSHITSAPAYILGAIFYILISTYYSISDTKIGPGILLVYIITAIALLQISLYFYIKLFKDWNSADIMKYAVIDEQVKAEDGTEMNFTHSEIFRSKFNELSPRYEELQQKYEEETKLTSSLKQEKMQEFRRSKLIEERKEQEMVQMKGELLRIERDRNEARERIKINEESIMKLKKIIFDLESEKRIAETNQIDGNNIYGTQKNSQYEEAEISSTKMLIQKIKELEKEIDLKDKEILKLNSSANEVSFEKESAQLFDSESSNIKSYQNLEPETNDLVLKYKSESEYLQQTLNQLSDERKMVIKENLTLLENVLKAQKTIDETDLKLGLLNSEIASLKNQIYDLNLQNSKNEEKIVLYAEIIKNQENQILMKNQEAASMRELVESKETELVNILKEAEDYKNKVAKLVEELSKAEIEKNEIMNTLTDLRLENQGLMEESEKRQG